MIPLDEPDKAVSILILGQMVVKVCQENLETLQDMFGAKHEALLGRLLTLLLEEFMNFSTERLG